MKHGKILFAAIFLLTTISLSVYAQLPLSDNMPAVGVLGQADFVTAPVSALPTASTMKEPKGIAVDPTTGKLFVADYQNRRVLRWSSTDKMINGAAAEAVLGEPDFTTNTGGTSSTLMLRPYGICVDAAGRLWVADLSGNRVLRFDNASTIASGSPANKVLGQADFGTATVNTGGISASTMSAPVGVFVDAGGNLWVSERDNKRVTKFTNAAAKDNGDPADVVLGQPDFITNTVNTGGISAATMQRAYGNFVDAGGRLWVADRDNNRVLRFDNAAAKTNGASADGVIGQTDFVSSASARTQPGISGPRSVSVDGLGRLYVMDEGNNRIAVYTNAAAKTNGANADNVLGQADFVSALNPNPPTASSLNFMEFIAIDNVNNTIWAADEFNYRILRFNVSPLPVELVSFSAAVKNSKVELHWATATEVNNAGFAVEKNTNNVWNKIGYVEGNGTSNAPKNYSFTENTSAGKYQYRLKQIDRDGRFEYSNVVEATVALTAAEYKLGQNYPNPFNPSTTITFALKNTEHATVTVYNMLGQEIATLFNGVATANEPYSLSFDARNLPSGMYVYALRSANRNEVKKMNLLK